jgi:peptidase E
MFMITVGQIDPHADMLLTSAGPTTEHIQQRLLEMGQSVSSDLRRLNVLRIADGWQPFSKPDKVASRHRVENTIGALTSRRWSHYINYVLGKPKMTTAVFGGLTDTAVEKLMRNADLVVVPGGNTWQTMKGLEPHKELFHTAIAEGKPYLSESAGSIVAGLTTATATLPPADVAPQDSSNYLSGLGLVNFDIAVHVAGRDRDFDIPGAVSKVMSKVMKSYETPHEAIHSFVLGHPYAVEMLNDVQAISVSHGITTRL